MRNTKKGFSLIEMIIAVTIVAILAVFLIPSFLGFRDENTAETDMIKFESIETAIKSAVGDESVRKDVEKFCTDEGTFTVKFYCDENAVLDIEGGFIIGSVTTPLKDTELWTSLYQSTGLEYQCLSGAYKSIELTYLITPKTDTSTVQSEMKIKYPPEIS